MTSEHWRRDVPQCLNIWDLELGEPAEPELLHGARAAVLSHDPQTDSTTYLARLPAGWQRREPADEATIELFLLDGDLTAAGRRVGSGGYACLPQGLGEAVELSSQGGCTALVYWNPNLPTFPPPYAGLRVTRAWDEPLLQRTPGSTDQVYRSLRLPDFSDQGFNGGPGGMLRLTTLSPGMKSPQQHVHRECWEEGVILAGDVFLGNGGLLGPGSYLSFPQALWHGILATQGGVTLIVHSNAPMGFPWTLRDHPLAHRMVDDYLDTMPLARPAGHVPWAESRYADWQSSPDYRAWLATEAASPWAGDEPHDTANAYRATWRRTLPTAEEA